MGPLFCFEITAAAAAATAAAGAAAAVRANVL